MIEVELLDDDRPPRDFNPVLLTVKAIFFYLFYIQMYTYLFFREAKVTFRFIESTIYY